MWLSWITVLPGFWSILSGLISDLTVSTNFIATGVVVAIMGFSTGRHWQGSIHGVIGIWLFISGFIPGLGIGPNFIISGLLIVALATWRSIEARPAPRPRHGA